MADRSSQQKISAQRHSLFARLRRDIRGNTMILTAAATLPIMGLIGGGIDVARAYASKTRLQNACDSGALAARRAMTGATPTDANLNEGKKFFDFNFNNGLFGVPATAVTRAYSAGTTAGTIKGTASVEMDYTIMKIFGETKVSLAVTCTATVSVPNTDVMFVLDVTGSMSSKADSDDTETKIQALRGAVKDFFRELGPGSASGAGRIRYGMVPYAHSVNVSSIIPSSAVIGSVAGETIETPSRTPITEMRREITGYINESARSAETKTQTGTWPSSWSSYQSMPAFSATDINGVSITNPTTGRNCDDSPLPDNHTVLGTKSAASLYSRTTPVYPATAVTNTYRSTLVDSENRYRWSKSGSGRSSVCTFQISQKLRTDIWTSTSTATAVWSATEEAWLTGWDYGLKTVDISGAVRTGSMANPAYWGGRTTLTDPNGTGTLGANATLTWDGCIEERPTVNTISADTTDLSIPATAYDMQIDLLPSAADNNTRWKPYLPSLQYYYAEPGNDGSELWWMGNSGVGSYSKCPTATTKLTQYTSGVDSTNLSSVFAAEVDKLQPNGYTYHDIGMIWGARLLSPTGMFASENSDANAPGGFQVSRHLVFMTDGEMNTPDDLNSAWGVNKVTGKIRPTNTSSSNLIAAHDKRMQMLCNAAKSKGFTIWVIVFATGTVPLTLQNCATDAEHWSYAANSAALKLKFQAIAETIGGLRLSQ